MSIHEKYNIQITAANIGPHENLNQCCDAGENGPIRIGVFSSNGGGKSSISKQFRLLNIDKEQLPLSNKFITLGQNHGKFKFKLFRQDDPSEKYEFEITHSLGNAPIINTNSKLLFHVFNSDYVRESIEPQNYGQDRTVEGYIMGKAMVDLSKEKTELAALRTEYARTKTKIDLGINAAKSELQQLGVRANTSEYSSITFENIIQGNTFQEEDSYADIKKALIKLKGIPDNLADIEYPKGLFSIDLDLISNITSDLTEDVSVSKLSDEFKESIKHKEEFIRLGVGLIEDDNKTCPFCTQSLEHAQTDLIDNFIAYIKDAETVYKNKLSKKIRVIESIKSHVEVKTNELLKIKLQYNNIKGYFPTYKDANIEITDSSSFQWSHIIDIINIRAQNVSIVLSKEQLIIVDRFIKDLENFQKSLNVQIEKINNQIKLINNTKLNTNNEVLLLKKRLCKSCYTNISLLLQKDIADLSKWLLLGKAKSDEIEQIEGRTKRLKRDVVVDTFNCLMKFIFHDKYLFDKETSSLKFKSYSLKTKAHDILSDGEKNVIAFCYYIAETHAIINKNSDYDNLFFVIDDPISSMDFYYTYSLCRILERLNDYFPYSNKKYLRFLLLTHNIEFMSILLRNNVIQKKYVLTNGKIKELKKELVMPYHEHLSDIYRVAHDIIEPTHTTPNSMRNVIETIAKFENPNIDLISYVDNNDDLKKCSSLYNMIQDLSHGIVRSQPAISPDDIKKGCLTIINFIENRYKGQIENVKKTV